MSNDDKGEYVTGWVVIMRRHIEDNERRRVLSITL